MGLAWLALALFNSSTNSFAPLCVEHRDMIAIHQRVYHNKRCHRRVGVVVEVKGDIARVQWDDSPSSSPQSSKIINLTVVDIQCASVILSSQVPRSPITCQFPPLGIVTDVTTSTSGACLCTVSWDDASVTTHSIVELYDVEWILPISLGTQDIQEWIATFQARHHVDIITTYNAGQYRCRRNHHVSDCKCQKNVADSCKCRCRILLERDGKVKLSGRHTDHSRYVQHTYSASTFCHLHVIDVSLTCDK